MSYCSKIAVPNNIWGLVNQCRFCHGFLICRMSSLICIYRRLLHKTLIWWQSTTGKGTLQSVILSPWCGIFWQCLNTFSVGGVALMSRRQKRSNYFGAHICVRLLTYKPRRLGNFLVRKQINFRNRCRLSLFKLLSETWRSSLFCPVSTNQHVTCAFDRRIHWSPMVFPHKGPVMAGRLHWKSHQQYEVQYEEISSLSLPWKHPVRICIKSA